MNTLHSLFIVHSIRKIATLPHLLDWKKKFIIVKFNYFKAFD
jgi:hypothetical protein